MVADRSRDGGNRVGRKRGEKREKGSGKTVIDRALSSSSIWWGRG